VMWPRPESPDRIFRNRGSYSLWENPGIAGV
jgi:hypothetical protein